MKSIAARLVELEEFLSKMPGGSYPSEEKRFIRWVLETYFADLYAAGYRWQSNIVWPYEYSLKTLSEIRAEKEILEERRRNQPKSDKPHYSPDIVALGPQLSEMFRDTVLQLKTGLPHKALPGQRRVNLLYSPYKKSSTRGKK